MKLGKVLDTRKKILSLEEVLRETQGRRIIWVRGSFDPLLAHHARRIAGLADPDAVLAVVLSEPAQPLLASRARAELAAALENVDYVIPDGAVPDGAGILELEDAAVRERFLGHVRQRHSGAKA